LFDNGNTNELNKDEILELIRLAKLKEYATGKQHNGLLSI